MVANSVQYGNGAKVAPGARVDDGELDLVVVEERWRFATFCRAPRLFTGSLARAGGCSILRIREATMLETEYEIPADFDVQEWNKDRDFVPPPGKTVARVLFSPDAARYAREDLPAKDCRARPDGSLEANVHVQSEVWFLSWLFQFGRGVEVLGPPELREKVRETCRAVLAFYDEPLPKG